MRRTSRTILAAICIAVITLSAALIAEKIAGRARIDLTEHGIYTLSEGTRNILAKLGGEVRLTLYYSRVAAMKGPEAIRYYNNYYLYVRSLLEEYVQLAKGRLVFSEYDPRPFSESEDEALAHGVRRFALSGDETFFFGLAAETELGKERVIPFFEPGRQEFVEYDISKLLAGVTRREKKHIGVMSSLAVMGSDATPYMMMQMQPGSAPWTIITHLRERYEVTKVGIDAEGIEDDIDFLMVIHPKGVSRKTLFAIDQFVMRGGKLIVFVDPHCLSDRPAQDPRNPYAAMGHETSSELNGLLAGWGVRMDPEVIAADRMLAVKAPVQRNGPPVPIVTYLELDEGCVNDKEVITAELHTLTALFAGVLEKVEGAGTTVTPLLATTKVANTWSPSGPFELAMFDADAVRRGLIDGTEELMLGCRITGELKSNFPEGVAEEEEEEGAASRPVEGEEPSPEEAEPAAEPLREASPEAAVLVFADVDMISDVLAYRETFFGTALVGDNASLVLNSVDFLSGSGDLIAIRSRGKFDRPFTRVEAIEREAERATQDQVEAINRKITDYEERLRSLGVAVTKENIKLVESKVLAERQKIEEEIRKARKELRRLNAGKRERIEALGWKLQTLNMACASAAVLAIAIVLAVIRYARAKRYAARRTR